MFRRFLRRGVLVACVIGPGTIGCSGSPPRTHETASASTHHSHSDAHDAHTDADGPAVLAAFPACRQDYSRLCAESGVEHSAREALECLQGSSSELRESCRDSLNPSDRPAYTPPPSHEGSQQGGGGHSH